MRRPTSPIQRTALPELAPYGILSPAVDFIYDRRESWLDGYTYETPDGRIAVAVGDMVGSTTTNTVVTDPKKDIYREIKPYNVRIEMVASSFAADYDSLEDTVKSMLKPMIQKAIEREFWNGVIASTITDTDRTGATYTVNRWLDKNTATKSTLPGATAGSTQVLKPKVGLALLEQALSNSTIGSLGTIHMPRVIASIIGLDNDEKTLYTNLLTPVVAGTGYQLEADGHTAWIFGTGPVTVRQGKPVVQADERGAFDRTTNTYRIVLNVPVAVTWSTSELQAVQVDLSLENN